jgi:hypothetical protein
MTTFGNQIFHSEATMEEKRETLANDRPGGGISNDTFFSRAARTLGSELGGRFSHEPEARPRIVGKGPLPYPQQPTGSPWAGADPTGDEPPLGIDVNAVPDVS